MGRSSDAGQGFEDVVTAFAPKLERPVEAVVGYELTIHDGGRSGTAQTVTIDPSQPTRMLLGQSPSCDVRVSDPQVSRRHLGLEVVDGLLRVTDLDSTNGTYVNQVRVTQALLRGGEQVMVGATSITVSARRAAKQKLAPESGFGRLVGTSEAMRKLYPLCRRLAAASVPVVIEGETGTGKEVLAESLHEEGPRSARPFVVFDCTTVAPSLVEAALFGHERGAFTGANETQPGVFERADGGTLLLDEIGDLDVALQAKLLRALERAEVQRVGGRGYRKVDVRVLAATRRDLDREVQAGRFRDDLYFRLAVARIELPPLRDRPGDIAHLARYFWHRLADPGTPPEQGFIERLRDYPWPGNVRELQNAVARRVALGELADGELSRPARSFASDGDFIDDVIAQRLPLPRARRQVVQELERRYTEEVLERSGGSVAEAARSSGIARRYFQQIRARSRRDED